MTLFQITFKCVAIRYELKPSSRKQFSITIWWFFNKKREFGTQKKFKKIVSPFGDFTTKKITNVWPCNSLLSYMWKMPLNNYSFKTFECLANKFPWVHVFLCYYGAFLVQRKSKFMFIHLLFSFKIYFRVINHTFNVTCCRYPRFLSSQQ